MKHESPKEISTNQANKYQELFNHMSEEYGLL